MSITIQPGDSNVECVPAELPAWRADVPSLAAPIPYLHVPLYATVYWFTLKWNSPRPEIHLFAAGFGAGVPRLCRGDLSL